LTRLIDGKKFNVYSPGETVVEVKIPVAYSRLSSDDIAKYPGLATIKNFLQGLTESHSQKYPINKGKMSKIEKGDIDREDTNQRRLFEDVLDDF
jgi:hypothetical protein